MYFIRSHQFRHVQRLKSSDSTNTRTEYAELAEKAQSALALCNKNLFYASYNLRETLQFFIPSMGALSAWLYPHGNARNRGRTVAGVWFECSRGGAGMMVRMPSNGCITSIGLEGSSAIWTSFRNRLPCLRNRLAPPKFLRAWRALLAEHPEHSARFGIQPLSCGPVLAHGD